MGLPSPRENGGKEDARDYGDSGVTARPMAWP
jgi:hypothetical protein